MAVKKLTPEDRRQLTRTTLVEAASEVFADKGFYGASLEEIAEVAGFTRGAIYSNFGSKEELLYAVIDHFVDRQLEDFVAVGERPADPVEDARSAAQIFGRDVRESRTITALDLELRLAALRNPEVRKRLAQLQRETGEKAARLVEEHVLRHSLSVDVSARGLADIGRAAVQGLMQMAWIDEENAEHYEALIETVFVMMARLAVPDDEAKPPRTRRQR